MSTEVSIRKSFEHGFVLNEQELRRIYNILVQQMNEVNSHEDFDTTFTMIFKNKITVEKSSIDDVFSENKMPCRNLCNGNGATNHFADFLLFLGLA